MKKLVLIGLLAFASFCFEGDGKGNGFAGNDRGNGFALKGGGDWGDGLRVTSSDGSGLGNGFAAHGGGSWGDGRSVLIKAGGTRTENG